MPKTSASASKTESSRRGVGNGSEGIIVNPDTAVSGAAGQPTGAVPGEAAGPVETGDAFPLARLVTGGKDKRGREVLDILVAVPQFKIYKTRLGIGPHFSDDPEVAARQMGDYLGLGPELEHVNHAIQRLQPGPLWLWVSGESTHYCNYCEHEVARGIAQGLVGEVEEGRVTLAVLAGRLEKRLRNRARVAYFTMCVVSAVVVTLLCLVVLGKSVFAPIMGTEVAVAAIMGSVGALLSTAVGLRNLRLDARARSLMNWIYGAQRMMVGVLGAIVLYLAIRAGFAPELIPVGAATGAEAGADGALDHYKLAFVSVLAGFSERLVPNLIDRNGVVGDESGDAGAPDEEHYRIAQATKRRRRAAGRPTRNAGSTGKRNGARR